MIDWLIDKDGGQVHFIQEFFFYPLEVPTVTWSKRLQKEAEDLLKNVTENGGIEKSRDYPGKLYLSPYETYPEEYCSTATWWFHHEEQYYNYSNPGFVKKAETFTQVGHICALQNDYTWSWN